MLKCKFKIFKFNPKTDDSFYFKNYTIVAEPDDKILDCLNKIRWEQDASLAYRMSCAHGICGSDAMIINGEVSLACQKLVKTYDTCEFTIEPLPVFKVIKDLVVDLDPFFKWYRKIKPYLITSKVSQKKERIQSEDDRRKIDDVIKCILCACCTASCPIKQKNEKYIGPAALVRAYRYIFDSRDQRKEERLKELNRPEGALGCKTYFKCTQVCPKDIKVTKSINQIKAEIQRSS